MITVTKPTPEQTAAIAVNMRNGIARLKVCLRNRQGADAVLKPQGDTNATKKQQ